MLSAATLMEGADGRRGLAERTLEFACDARAGTCQKPHSAG